MEQKRDRLHIEYCKKEKSINDELEYQRLCSHLEELNALRQQCKELNEQIQECVSDREIINNEILEVEETIHKFKDKKLDSFDDVLRAYDIGLLDIRESNENLNGKRQKLCDSIFCYVSQKKLLERINQNIIEEEKVEEEVQHILLEARKIIEQRKSRVCPVCNTSFQSSHELMENTYRTVSLKGENLKKMREKQEVLLDKSKDYCLKNLEEYQIVIDEIVVEVENKKQQIKKKYEEKSMQEGYLCILLKEKQEKIERIQLEDQEQGLYVIYTKEGIESWYALWKAKQEAELLELKSRLELSKNQVQLCYEIQNELKQSIKNSQETMLRIANEMKDTFSVLRKSENLIKKYSYFEINQHVIETEKEREELLQKLEMLEEELCNYQEILLSMEESYEKEKEDLEISFQVKEKKASELLERIHNVFQNMEINDLNITKEQIKKKEEELNSENLKRENVIELLENLKYNNEIENYFTEWKKTNQLFRDTEKKKDKQEVVVENAQKAYQCAVRTIQQEMQEFLRQFQVSDIYEKLEPHEELKTLIGEFDFNDDGKPELSFQVSDKTGKKYSPEWYFSTAQLNVVAFSVFLGRALKTETEPIKSILIDDPVGHFDDMNIVGFVNLLQNIIENTDRQLIISTHEERVFGLIQRKIPEKEYPVKYIDFRKEI